LNQTSSAVLRRQRRRGQLGVAAVVGAIMLVVATIPAAAAAPGGTSGSKFTARPLTGTRVVGAKSASGQLAETDKGLLGLRSSAPVNVVVKLDYDSYAGYRGGVRGYAATSPSVTGRRLNLKDAGVRRYAGYVQGMEGEFVRALRSRLPAAQTGRSLRTVYGGVAVRVAGNKVADLLRLPGVAAVQKDEARQPLTDASPRFIGAPTLYRKLGGAANAGKGVIVGVLDSGAWPEHPSYADRGNLPAPPPKEDGTPRTCDFGDNPLTPATDVFACNNKLISGQPFLETYGEIVGFDDETYPDSARDSNGHGTHTSTTAAGGPVANADPLGVDRGRIHGIAPGAHVAVYKVCGAVGGCFSSDSAAAVAQAILDGVKSINFSISGGNNPFTDAVELAFLDAYAAGVHVSASAGNDGPGPDTVNHRSPWVNTVAASTQKREFQSTLTLTGDGATETLTGASITQGAGPAPVVLASSLAGYNVQCLEPAPAGSFTGKIVACQRGVNARVDKGFNVLQGGAVGMILYNVPGQADVETDNHWLPTVHLNGDQGQVLTAFLAAHAAATAEFTAGEKVQGRGDVMADFSSRGPGGDWLKPDITAPGVQILAGHTPTPESTELGPPGQLFQAIAGTSMSSPHIAGSAALLFALHPDWSPGQVKSALLTTAKTAGVVKEDGETPADPFDFGSGRVNLNLAGNPGLTFDESAADYAAAAVDELGRIDLNVPSVNAPVMPGRVTTSRVAKNVTRSTLRYRVTTEAPAGAEITVTPSSFTLAPGARIRLRIRISAPSAAVGQYFGRINLDNRGGGGRDLHLPVAFFRTQGDVTLNQTCEPAAIALETGRSTCEVTVQNNSLQDTSAVARSRLTSNLQLTSVDGAFQASPREVVGTANLRGRELASPGIAPGASPAGYIPLDAFPDVTPIPIGDEEAINISGLAAPFRFADEDYDTIGVTSNGYSVAGGVTSAAEIQCCPPQQLPDPALPNSVLAPFWTDLDGTDAPGILAAELSDGTATWLVIEWRLNIFGTTSQRVFQHWLGEGGAEDISFVYDPDNLPAAPTAGLGLTVGAENQAGTAGDQIAPTDAETPPTEDLRVTSTPGTPGGTLAYSFELKGVATGVGEVRTTMRSPLVRGTTTDFDQINVEGT
jgi:subtilisin family serine protease